MLCFHVSDLHGIPSRFESLIHTIESERPDAVFIGGDIFPHALVQSGMQSGAYDDFVGEFIAPRFLRLRDSLGDLYPKVFVILGNDDVRVEEQRLMEFEKHELWRYLHMRQASLGAFTIYGYACVPPTPFRIKDWERYDVSRHVEPGDIPPEEGWRSVDVPENEIRFGTIKRDLQELTGDTDLGRTIMLFHAPPYKTKLDRAALDGQMIDHVPLDVHVGSVAITQFIEDRSPLITLHGHIHESARITGDWRDQIGTTHMFSAAHDGPELALVRFDPADLDAANRELI